MLVRATISGTYAGQKHVNVVHFQRPDVTSIIYFSLAQRIADFFLGFVNGGVDQNMRWNNIRIEDRTLSGQAMYDYPIALAGTLGPSSQFCPFICACFLFYTDVAGRHGRGRMFQGGYGHGNNFNNGNWLNSTQDRLDNVALEWTNYWIHDNTFSDDWKLCVAARDEHELGNNVIRIVGRNRVSTMNTRKIGRGA